jgi:hypothetical protein
MSAYTNAILRYGLLAPLALNGLMLAAAAYGNMRLSNVISQKQAAYRQFKAKEAEVAKLEDLLKPKRATFEDHKLMLRADPALVFPLILDTQVPKYKPLELERNSLLFPPEPGPINRGVATEAVRVRSTWEGGYGPMQEILLQVESLMPQATLEELKISRKPGLLSGQPERLMFEMTHVCWKFSEEEKGS